MKRGAPLTPSPILDGDQLYTVSDNGIASCLDAKTGKVHWQERVPGAYSASPILAGKLVYLTNEAGRTTVVRASSKFEVVATNDLKELTYSSIAAVNGVVYIRTEKNLYRIEPKQPAP
jgi:outer membrane protein assembly factor BamB